ncbi:MAG: hypothetical protein ACMVY4_13450 [Minwuia sp.]|uniref:hypothetical protein n=1 Tax=Minwuia sp. TaxID=2493630 RepID=UPI003A869C5B
MPKISFNPKAVGRTVDPELTDMCDPILDGAFVPLVLPDADIETVIEVFRLTYVERIPPIRE